MKHRLSRPRSDVEHGAVSLFDVALARNLGGGQVAAAYRFSVSSLRLFQSSEMFLRDDQHVRGRLRIDVFKGEDVIVLLDFLGGNFAT